METSLESIRYFILCNLYFTVDFEEQIFAKNDLVTLVQFSIQIVYDMNNTLNNK